MEPGYDKLPPQNLEAEQSVLGAILLDNKALDKCLEIIKDEDLYRESHRKIFRAMLDLYDKNEAVDLITTAEQLEKKGELDAAGGAAYLASLASMVPTAANIRYHSRIIKEKSVLRSLLRASNDISVRVYEESGSGADEALDFAEQCIFDISENRVKAPFSKMSDVVTDSFKTIEELFERKETVTGLASGFHELDDLTTGFQKGDLIIVGGRPSMGKTALSLNIAQHAGVELKESVAIFSLEMSTRQLVMRMLCSEARVDSNKVRKGFVAKEDWHKLTSAATRLSEAHVFIDDNSSLSVLEMRAKARRLKMEHGLSLIVVDYIQLMKGRTGLERREQEISDISRSLKGLAKELDVPVIALSQLNRGVETRPGRDKRPGLADLRESGAIEQDADVILFLYRPEVYDRENPELKGRAEIIVAKQRNGPTDTVHLAYNSFCTRFENPAKNYHYEPGEAAEVF